MNFLHGWVSVSDLTEFSAIARRLCFPLQLVQGLSPLDAVIVARKDANSKPILKVYPFPSHAKGINLYFHIINYCVIIKYMNVIR